MTRIPAGDSELDIRVETTPSTEDDFPRESLGRIVVNYAPSALLVFAMVVYPSVVGYLWIDKLFYFIGDWGYLPILVIFAPTAVGLLLFLFRARRFSSAGPTPWLVVVCRTGCALIQNFILLMLVISITMIPVHISTSNWLPLLIHLMLLPWECLYLSFSWRWYRRCWYEKAIIAQNEERYGHTVFVSSPVFKLCGHFVVIIRDRKYELRLDASTRHQPVFKDRLLQPGEADKLRGALGHHWSLIGWTRRGDAEINAAFTDVIQAFGMYNRMRNNCRHFLHEGCSVILDEIASDDMVMAAGHLDISVIAMAWMLWKSSQRELYRWGWSKWYGPDWESRAVSEASNSVMLEDLREYFYIPDWFVEATSGLWVDGPRPDDRWVAMCLRMLLPVCGVTLGVAFIIWHNTQEAPYWGEMSPVLLVGLSGIFIIALVAGVLIWAGLLIQSPNPVVLP